MQQAPYSPDLNPTEKMGSKIKAYLRKVEARTKETLPAAMAAALETVTASEASNWLASCGYTQEWSAPVGGGMPTVLASPGRLGPVIPGEPL